MCFTYSHHFWALGSAAQMHGTCAAPNNCSGAATNCACICARGTCEKLRATSSALITPMPQNLTKRSSDNLDLAHPTLTGSPL
jgi:hypothetical protein